MMEKLKKIIIAVAIILMTLLTVILPLILFHRKASDSDSQLSVAAVESFSEESVSISSEEIVSSDTQSTSTPATQKHTAPVPKNFVKAIDKEEVKQEVNYEKPAPTVPTKLINAPYINQNDSYPTGCESVSAVMALNYMGYSITVNSFIDNYLDKAITPYIGDDGNYYGYDPREYFLGDPYSKKGWGCLAPVIVNALNRCINHNSHSVINITGSSLLELRSYLDRDIPVIVWATQGMQKTRKSKTWTIVGTDRKYTWTAPNHCLLLLGYDDTGYYFNDPLTHANCRYAADVVENRYNAMGRQAIVITKITNIQLPEEPQDNSQNEEEQNTDSNVSDETQSDTISDDNSQDDDTEQEEPHG